MQSKFWAAGAESSESECTSESDDQEQPQQQKKPAAPPSRWAAAETSSSDDEARVVKSLKDRRWGAMREVIRQMENHMKILDFAELGKDYDSLLKSYSKAQQVIEQEGVPAFFVRSLVSLEKFIEEKTEKKENIKKLSKGKALALNTLRAKVRKTTESWAKEIRDCRENPEKYETESEESDDADSDSDFSDEDSSEESEESQDSSSQSESDGKNKSDSEEASEWSDSEADEESQETGTAAAAGAAGSGAAAAETEAGASPQEIQENSASILTSFVERLDNDLIKSLQATEEYKERLGKSIDILALLWRAMGFLDKRKFYSQAATMALRINEHMHYKPDNIAVKVWDVVRKELPEELCKDLPGEGADIKPTEFVEKLTRYVFQHSISQREKIRALLHVSYSKSLHDDYYQARDLMHTPNVQELAMQTDISTQILYNRNLVQLGLCAFRNGLIQDAHACLAQICPKHKELLAQGVSNLKNVERTQEQERAEKRRVLPYHMHISMELIECVHNICAMLLEVPHMAHEAFDPCKRPISRHFRRALEAFERQPFVGPPESPREAVMAATRALQRGDWRECAAQLWALGVWDKMPRKEQVQQMLSQKIKAEAMRTYIFTYLPLYDSFSIGQLANMFDLSLNAVHSIVSKMMINEEIHASWDETSQYILISRVKHTRLQQLALTLAENVANAVEQNELTLNMKNPK
ncbi:eukaryotic translation initiation factor 3 subunit 8, putative [Eimeria brunetti]|uniref:Eukaryotic translation initiation factor 3 subunit C n=1 Tax=Eimeria brunetti TaxID=51314 RepID=U6LEQ1_9EIME|nr:eukaryotic translation initiation factor 3 subunit 8, putative [Eimeria brunetti]